MKTVSYTSFVTSVYVAVFCIDYTYGMAGQCIMGPKIVTACTNHSVPTEQMLIPVNGSIGQGCACDVIIFQAPNNSTRYSIIMKHANQVNISCGYKVEVITNTNYSITCSEFGSHSNTLKLNQHKRLRFTTHHASDPTNKTGFCLSVSSQDTNVKMEMNCWEQHTPAPLTEPTTSAAHTPTASTAQQLRTSIMPLSPLPKTPRSAPATISSLTNSAIPSSTTKSTHVENPRVTAIGGGIGGGILLLVVIIVIIWYVLVTQITGLCKRQHQNNYNKPSDIITESTKYNNLRVKDEMVIIDNDDKNQSTASPTSGLQHVQLPVTSSVHNKLKKSNAGPGCVTTDVQQSVMTADHIKSTSSPDDMSILENDLYVSADSFPNSAAEIDDNTSDDDLNQTQFAFNQGANNVYAVVNKTRKPNTDVTF